MASIVNNAAFAKKVLEDILEERKIIEAKKDIHMGALEWGANALEKACANGASFYREAAIVRYHANNRGAYLLCDEYTRGALKAAVFVLRSQAQKEAGGGH